MAKANTGANAQNKQKTVVENDPVFAVHPKLDVYYKTSDGAAFFTPNAAENHAKTLEDITVKKVTK